jgi:predicted ATPase
MIPIKHTNNPDIVEIGFLNEAGVEPEGYTRYVSLIDNFGFFVLKKVPELQIRNSCMSPEFWSRLQSNPPIKEFYNCDHINFSPVFKDLGWLDKVFIFHGDKPIWIEQFIDKTYTTKFQGFVQTGDKIHFQPGDLRFF